MTEVWKPVVGFEDTYEISDVGRIRRIAPPLIFLDGWTDKGGYKRVFLRGHGRRPQFGIHRLVYAAFHGPLEDGKEVAHLDGNPANNAAGNLALVTPAENTAHKKLHGTFQTGEQHPRSKLRREDIEAIKAKAASGVRTRDIAEEFGVGSIHIRRIVLGKRWAEGMTDGREFND